MTALLCALLSGAMFYLSQGQDDVWWLTWLAPAPLLWLAYGPVKRWQLFVAALAAYACGQIYVAQTYGGAMPALALAVMMFGWGALFAAATLLARTVWQRLSPPAALLAFPAAWTAIEYGVGLISPHGSWGALGYSQVSFPPAIQIASLFGLYAITLPPREPASALTMTLGSASSIRVASEPLANPPNTTQWIAPMRAQASIAKAASGIIGM